MTILKQQSTAILILNDNFANLRMSAFRHCLESFSVQSYFMGGEDHTSKGACVAEMAILAKRNCGNSA